MCHIEWVVEVVYKEQNSVQYSLAVSIGKETWFSAVGAGHVVASAGPSLGKWVPGGATWNGYKAGLVLCLCLPYHGY